MILSIGSTGPMRRARHVLRVVALASLAMSGAPAGGRAQGATDLFLARLRETGGRLSADSVARLTDRDGYDNQPQFVVDGASLFYTSIDAGGQADIHRLDLRTRQSVNLTRTAPESEYSATRMPGVDRMSVIRVEADSTQRLWSFRLDGTDPRLVLERIAPVGYQAWVDADRVAVYVLGDPATLQLVNVRTGEASVLTSDIGRSLNPVPGRTAISFVRRDGRAPGWIEEYDVASGETRRLVRALPGNEYHAWTPSGTLISAAGSTLYAWRPGDPDWTPIGDLAASGVSSISRLTVSPDGHLLAFVAAH